LVVDSGYGLDHEEALRVIVDHLERVLGMAGEKRGEKEKTKKEKNIW
jgi:hypothetical protein